MEFDPSVYNKKNRYQYDIANELIERITEENKEKNFDICIDIGCGTGNVTLMLKNMLDINQLYAIDIDNKMVEFAKLNHNQQNIQYITQDISVGWDQLKPELKALEGKVSLIFTNQVLHWVVNKENAANNIFRFLSDEGKLYANILWNSDPFSHLTGEERIVHEKQIIFPTPHEQMEIWCNSFKKVGFHSVQSEFLEKHTIFEDQEYKEGILVLDVNCRKQYIVEKDLSKKIDVIDRMARSLMEKNKKFFDESTGKAMIVWEYGIFRFVLHKN